MLNAFLKPTARH